MAYLRSISEENKTSEIVFFFFAKATYSGKWKKSSGLNAYIGMDASFAFRESTHKRKYSGTLWPVHSGSN